jgi:hypothetical protein
MSYTHRLVLWSINHTTKQVAKANPGDKRDKGICTVKKKTTALKLEMLDICCLKAESVM